LNALALAYDLMPARIRILCFQGTDAEKKYDQFFSCFIKIAMKTHIFLFKETLKGQ